jgi:hypothetical protein
MQAAVVVANKAIVATVAHRIDVRIGDSLPIAQRATMVSDSVWGPDGA